MKDLYRCLDEYPPQMLRAIAEAWQTVLPEGETLDLVGPLAEAMLRPNALSLLVESLTPEARGVLAEFVEHGGVLPGQRLALRFGGIRRLGPARIERERPWQEPANTLEELYYKGLVYRAYGRVENHSGEIFIVPQQLLDRLPAPLMTMPSFSVETALTPARIVVAGYALIEDLFAALVSIRQGQYPATQQERSDITPISVERLALGDRLIGPNQPARLALIQRLLWRLRLLHDEKGFWKPSLRAREWLRLTDEKRWRSVFLAWRDDPQWDELRLLPSLRCEDTGWQNQPIVGRRNLLDVLGKCPPGQWLSLDSFIQALRRYRPDYLRPDGDFDSWFIRDARTNEYLRGLAAWEEIEGALARYIIAHPLFWLGCVELGYSEGAEQPFAFRLTTLGHAALTGMAAPRTDLPSVLATISDDFTVVIPLAETMYQRYQLERLAEWQGQDETATYRLTAESVWQSYNAGIKTDQILAFLKRLSGDRVSPHVLRSLQAWGGRFGRVLLRRAVVVQAVDEPTMKQISARPELRALITDIIAPTMCLVEEEHLGELVKQLNELGIWPHFQH